MSPTLEVQIENSTPYPNSHTTKRTPRAQRTIMKKSSQACTAPQVVHEPSAKRKAKTSEHNSAIEHFFNEQICRAPRYASIRKGSEDGYVLQMQIPRFLSGSVEIAKLVTAFERRSSLRPTTRERNQKTLDSANI